MKKKPQQEPEEDLQEEVETAFLQSQAGHELFGEVLRPYSGSRIVAAQSMGLKYPNLTEAEIESVKKKGVYPGSLLDIVVLTWVCTLPDSGEGWTPNKALRRPESATEAAMEWAEGKGILNTASPQHLEAFNCFSQIVGAVAASEFKVEVDGAGGGGADDGPKV